jgi:hypothetical protein
MRNGPLVVKPERCTVFSCSIPSNCLGLQGAVYERVAAKEEPEMAPPMAKALVCAIRRQA